MALITKNLAYFDNGGFIIDYEYDDVALQVTRVIVSNSGKRDYDITVISTNNRRSYNINSSKLVGIIDQSIPNGAQNRLGLSVTPSGKLDGLEWSIVELNATKV